MGQALLRLTLLGALAGLLAYGLMRQHLTGARLQEQWLALRAQAASAAALKRENARLRAERPSPPELARLRRAAAETEGPGAATGTSVAAAEKYPRLEAAQWKLAGRATPARTFESVLWAATHQDVEALAGLIGFDAKQREQADAFFAGLPEATRQKYGSPEGIAATMLAANTPANLSAIDTLGRTGSGDQATLLMRVERSDGTQKDSFFKFQKGDDGWSLLVPREVLQGYAEQLTGKADLPATARASGAAQ